MQTQINKAQIESYEENGFLHITDFFNESEIVEWRKNFDEAVHDRLTNHKELMTNQRNPDHYFAKVFIQCNRLMDTHAGMKELLVSEELGKVAAALSGVDGIRIFHDQSLIKPPHGNATVWHIDTPYWSFDSHDAMSYWIPLDDATTQNGCLAFLPGTHKLSKLDKNIRGAVNVSELFKLYPEFSEIEPVIVEAGVGDIIFFNGLTAHAAGANLTNRHRRAMTCILMPDGLYYNGKRSNGLPAKYMASLKIGDLLNNDEINPLLWTT